MLANCLKILYHQILYYISGEVTNYELDTYTGSRVIKNFREGRVAKRPPGGIGLRYKAKIANCQKSPRLKINVDSFAQKV